MKAQTTMTIFSKFVALALLATSAAIVSSAHPSSAQFLPATGIDPREPCCKPATKRFFTGSPGWTVKAPSAPTAVPAAIITSPNSAWSTLSGSQWIGIVAGAGQNNVPGGTYVYTYHLGCLCGVPKPLSNVPVTLTLQVYADDDVTVKLNGNVIGQHTGGYGFNHLTALGPITAHFYPACDNILTFEVPNWDGVSLGRPAPLAVPVSANTAARIARAIPNATPASAPSSAPMPPGSPAGLDVVGTIAGYFVDAPNDRRCPVCPQTRQSGGVVPLSPK